MGPRAAVLAVVLVLLLLIPIDKTLPAATRASFLRKAACLQQQQPAANGAEDIEFAAPVDILRRAGVKVVVASLGDSLTVKTAQGLRIEGDILLQDVTEANHYDVIVIPGG
ncbi:hypothetical protein EBH_0016790 [Eimeria brunetti]|uniref:DJ-1/PfpI domain-containing protein n=1 Tax=Eimeria brunetti TaxID=51314 RepID=U6LEE7_9EIME|nr:hypothetical protein EBH_0016790 [Eimeria brunetti]